MSPSKTPRMFSGRFWMSFVITVVVTSMLPVFQVTDSDGETIGSAGVYHAYIALFQDFSAQTFFTVLLHIAACFILAFGVRWNILRLQSKYRSKRQ